MKRSFMGLWRSPNYVYMRVFIHAVISSILLEFSDLMDCNSVTQSMNFTLASSGKGSTPTVNSGSVQCQTMSNGSVTPSLVLGATVSAWYWKGTIDNVADGILTITINNPQNQNGVGTGVSHLLTVRFLAPVLTNHYARFIRQSTTFSFGRARQITSWSSRIPTTTQVRSPRAVTISSSITKRLEPRC